MANLNKDPRPVDAVDGAKITVGCVLMISKNSFYGNIQVIWRSIHTKAMDIAIQHCCHLQFLNLCAPTFWKEDNNIHPFQPLNSVDYCTSCIPRGSYKHSHVFLSFF